MAPNDCGWLSSLFFACQSHFVNEFLHHEMHFNTGANITKNPSFTLNQKCTVKCSMIKKLYSIFEQHNKINN